MIAAIVFDSLFGNTKAVAEAIARGLSSTYETRVISAAAAGVTDLESCDLLVVGSPTHGHGLPKPETRAAGRKSGVPESVVTAPGVRELLQRLPSGSGRAAAAFDTSLRGPRWLWGAASRPIARALRKNGYSVALAPETFLIHGMRTPTMLTSELERATAWGSRLGASVPTTSTAGRAA